MLCRRRASTLDTARMEPTHRLGMISSMSLTTVKSVEDASTSESAIAALVVVVEGGELIHKCAAPRPMVRLTSSVLATLRFSSLHAWSHETGEQSNSYRQPCIPTSIILLLHEYLTKGFRISLLQRFMQEPRGCNSESDRLPAFDASSLFGTKPK